MLVLLDKTSKLFLGRRSEMEPLVEEEEERRPVVSSSRDTESVNSETETSRRSSEIKFSGISFSPTLFSSRAGTSSSVRMVTLDSGTGVHRQSVLFSSSLFSNSRLIFNFLSAALPLRHEPKGSHHLRRSGISRAQRKESSRTRNRRNDHVGHWRRFEGLHSHVSLEAGNGIVGIDCATGSVLQTLFIVFI